MANEQPSIFAKYSLEEQLWFKNRRESIQRHVLGGACIGASVVVGLVAKMPRRFSTGNRFVLLTAFSSIGAMSGFLYADKKFMAQTPAPGNRNRLRAEYEAYASEMKASRTNRNEPVVTVSPEEFAARTK